jgi:hypothetical protein
LKLALLVISAVFLDPTGEINRPLMYHDKDNGVQINGNNQMDMSIRLDSDHPSTTIKSVASDEGIEVALLV